MLIKKYAHRKETTGLSRPDCTAHQSDESLLSDFYPISGERERERERERESCIL